MKKAPKKEHVKTGGATRLLQGAHAKRKDLF
jgi:hypothetical protein